MISKEKFVKYLKLIEKTFSKEAEVDKCLKVLGVGESCSIYDSEVAVMTEMLCDLMGIKYNYNDTFGDEIQNYILKTYKLKVSCFLPEHGKIKSINSPEQLYDFICEHHAKIPTQKIPKVLVWPEE